MFSKRALSVLSLLMSLLVLPPTSYGKGDAREQIMLNLALDEACSKEQLSRLWRTVHVDEQLARAALRSRCDHAFMASTWRDWRPGVAALVEDLQEQVLVDLPAFSTSIYRARQLSLDKTGIRADQLLSYEHQNRLERDVYVLGYASGLLQGAELNIKRLGGDEKLRCNPLPSKDRVQVQHMRLNCALRGHHEQLYTLIEKLANEHARLGFLDEKFGEKLKFKTDAPSDPNEMMAGIQDPPPPTP